MMETQLIMMDALIAKMMLDGLALDLHQLSVNYVVMERGKVLRLATMRILTVGMVVVVHA